MDEMKKTIIILPLVALLLAFLGTGAADAADEYALGIQELEKENIVDAMQHFIQALPNEVAEKKIYENAYDYVDELMFAEDYEAAQTFMLEYQFDGYEKMLAECNNHCFSSDLVKGWREQAEISEVNMVHSSNQQYRAYLLSLVDSEAKYLFKYLDMGFTDTELAEYVYTYIGALQNQMVGISYYGDDNGLYEEYWNDLGYTVKSRMAFLINRKYGINAPGLNITKMLDDGYNEDVKYKIKKMFTEQLSNADISLNEETYGGNTVYSVYFNPLRICNTSGYSLGDYLVQAIFLDDKEHATHILDLFWDEQEKLRDGEYFPWQPQYTYGAYDAFSSFYFNCRFYDAKGYRCEIKVYPPTKYSWGGKGTHLIVDGQRTASENGKKIALEGTKTYWTTRFNLFVPAVEFALRNAGNIDIDEAIIECVFVNTDNNTEWSREKCHAVSSLDVPLSAGRARNAIVYSTIGYEKKTRKVANLKVEIYVNGEPVDTVEVSKP